MSERTPEERAVEESIRTAIQTANPGTIVTGWVIVVQTTVPDDTDSSAYVYTGAVGQSIALTLGPLDMGTQYHTRRIGDAGETP